MTTTDDEQASDHLSLNPGVPSPEWRRWQSGMRLGLRAAVVGAATIFIAAGCGRSSTPTAAPEVFEWFADHGVQCVDLSATGAFDADQRLCVVAEDEDSTGPPVMIEAGEDSIKATMAAEYLGSGPDDLDVVASHLKDLFDWPAGTVDRMKSTRALDGTQEAEGVTWTYHPDDGLVVVIVP